jgi:GTP-binding protein HflX
VGPGESKLETDRRHIRRHIDRLEEEFERIRRVRGVQREKRIKSEIPLAAIVGYTNAGKSTLLNTLTGAGIAANDRLFDTLDPTARKLKIDENLTVIFSDTVGFIRKLPHKLVEAFKATLEELEFADVILHVIDISNPEWENHVAVVERLIGELGVAATPRIRVFNKADIAADLPPLRESDVCISAKTGMNIDRLLDTVRSVVSKPLKHIRVSLKYTEASLVDSFYREAKVSSVEYKEDAIVLDVTCTEALLGQMKLSSYEVLQ